MANIKVFKKGEPGYEIIEKESNDYLKKIGFDLDKIYDELPTKNNHVENLKNQQTKAKKANKNIQLS